MQRTIVLLKEHNELKIIDEELDIDLEIPHIAYLEVKRADSKALLFTKPICKKTNRKFDIPVLCNLFGSYSRLELLAPKAEEIAKDIESFMKLSSPKGIGDIFKQILHFSTLRYIFPKKSSTTRKQRDINLFDLPILKTWEHDGGAFITMGQVYSKSLNGEIKNLGMYRLQVYDEKTLGLHWQIHKDSTHFFNEYKKAGVKMPISIGIGGDPLYTWCGQAPLPYGMYELMLYGFIKKERPKVAKCFSNDLYVPSDCDIVIDGFVDTTKLRDEGPFGDHTGFYTPIEPYPILEVTSISMKENPIYVATVVGKPPLEDKYMGYLTERVFLPLLKTTTPNLLDYYMPENGVFHNLILAKLECKYPSHAKQVMHSFWGVGQMSFVKHAIFVPEDAPRLQDSISIAKYILNHLNFSDLVFSSGICDALDHSSPSYASGGKLGIDCTNGESKHKDIEILDNEELFNNIKAKYSEVVALRQYFSDCKNPIILLCVDKKSRVLEHINAFDSKHCRIIFVLDKDNDLDNLYMCLWRIVNNIDANRDILLNGEVALIDATAKGELEGHNREWPKDVDCTKEVLESLASRGIIERDLELWRRYHIDKSYESITKF